MVRGESNRDSDLPATEHNCKVELRQSFTGKPTVSLAIT